MYSFECIMNKYLTIPVEYSINMVQVLRIGRKFVSFLSFLDSSMAEHTAVNRGVVGSSPTRGVKLKRVEMHKAPWSSG